VLVFQHTETPTIEVFPAPSLAVSKPGSKVRSVVAVTAMERAPPGEHRIRIRIRGWGKKDPVVEIPLSLVPAPDCSVDPMRELFVIAPSVVDDPVRTRFEIQSKDQGAWTFARLMEEAAPEPGQAPAMAQAMLESWLHKQTINSFVVPPRPSMNTLVLKPWPKREDGQLDLERAPFRLQAIVARLDLADLSKRHAGELRFVFGLLSPGGSASLFTMIFEYRIPASSQVEVDAWAKDFHALSELPFPSEAYNSRLQTLTESVTTAGVNPNGVNGSALFTLRTNEAALEALWELRQFKLSKPSGMLRQTTIDRTPDRSFRDHALVAEFINANEDAILKGDYELPNRFGDRPFLAAAAPNMFPAWTAPGIRNPEARRQFALNTCDGCHGSPVTGTDFTHVRPRKPGVAARLSGFLLGIALEDPTTGKLETYNELGRRMKSLERVVCACSGPAPCPPPERTKHRDH
jgi:hypothetical protein